MITYNTITNEDTTTLVGLLTIEQKDLLVGVKYAPDALYNPIEDANGDYIISIEEIASTINPDILWVKDLPLIQYQPKPSPPFPG